MGTTPLTVQRTAGRFKIGLRPQIMSKRIKENFQIKICAMRSTCCQSLHPRRRSWTCMPLLSRESRPSWRVKRNLTSAEKTIAPESESDDEMSVQVISAPKKKLQKKPNNTSNVIVEKRKYQKKLKWLKDHGELTGEEGKNPGEESSGDKSSST